MLEIIFKLMPNTRIFLISFNEVCLNSQDTTFRKFSRAWNQADFLTKIPIPRIGIWVIKLTQHKKQSHSSWWLQSAAYFWHADSNHPCRHFPLECAFTCIKAGCLLSKLSIPSTNKIPKMNRPASVIRFHWWQKWRHIYVPRTHIFSEAGVGPG